MHEYTLMIALAYFKERDREYVLSELKEMLGFTSSQLDSLINVLITRGYIEYRDVLMRITPKGITYLIANERENLSVSAENFTMIHINPQNAMPLNEPYVPKEFSKKYDG